MQSQKRIPTQNPSFPQIKVANGGGAAPNA